MFDHCAEVKIIGTPVGGREADVVHHGSRLEHSLADHHVCAEERIVGEDEQVGVGEEGKEGRLEVAEDGCGEVGVGAVDSA